MDVEFKKINQEKEIKTCKNDGLINDDVKI